MADELDRLSEAESGSQSATKTNEEDTESRALNNGSQDDSNDTDDWDTNLSKGEKRRFRFRRKQALVGSGVAGILIGASMGISGFLSGPAMIVQLGSIIEKHFGDNERFNDSRTGKLIRWARYRNEPNKRNMGFMGNKLANHYEGKLIKNGMRPDYEGGTGRRIRAIDIDTSTPEGKKSLEKMRAAGFDVPDPPPGEKFAKLNLSDSNARTRRRAVSAMMNSLDINGVSTSIGSRALKIRGGVDFHPLKNAAKSVDEDIRDYINKRRNERAERVQKGTEPDTRVGAGDRADDPNNPASEEAKAQAREVDAKTEEVKRIAGDPNATPEAKISGVKRAVGAGVGATAVVGLICGLDALGDQSALIQESNIILPLMRLAWEIIAAKDQIKTGVGANMDEIGALHAAFYDVKTKSSVFDAESINALTGKPGVGKKLPDSAKPGKDKPGFFKAVDAVTDKPVISQICSTVNSTFGGIVLALGTIAVTATSPAGAFVSIVGEAGQELVTNAFIDDFVRWLAGDPLDVRNLAGHVLGGGADTGAFLAANNLAGLSGGLGMSTPDVVKLRHEEQLERQAKMKQKSLYERFVDPYEPDSLFATAVLRNGNFASINRTVSTVLTTPLKAFQNLGNSFAGVIPGLHAATEPYDYGVDKIGYTLDEIDSERYDNPYENADRIEGEPGKLQRLNEKYGRPCFGAEVDPSTGAFRYTQAPSYMELENNSGLAKCKDRNNVEFTDYRFYLADRKNLTAIACYEGLDEQACDEMGLTTNTSGPGIPGTVPNIEGLECPANITNTIQIGSTTYYQLPPAPNGEYTIYSREARRYGHRELVCVLYTVAKAYATAMEGKSRMDIGDLNAAGHKSHRWGVAVDLDARGEITAADHVNEPRKYSTEATILLGKLFVDTGFIKNIWWCADDGSIEAIRGYAVSVGKPITIKCISGHANHFHVDINVPRGSEYTP